MTKNVTTTIRLPPDLRDKAKDKAAREDLTFSQAIRRLLLQWIEEQEEMERLIEGKKK